MTDPHWNPTTQTTKDSPFAVAALLPRPGHKIRIRSAFMCSSVLAGCRPPNLRPRSPRRTWLTWFRQCSGGSGRKKLLWPLLEDHKPGVRSNISHKKLHSRTPSWSTTGWSCESRATFKRGRMGGWPWLPVLKEITKWKYYNSQTRGCLVKLLCWGCQVWFPVGRGYVLNGNILDFVFCTRKRLVD